MTNILKIPFYSFIFSKTFTREIYDKNRCKNRNIKKKIVARENITRFELQSNSRPTRERTSKTCTMRKKGKLIDLTTLIELLLEKNEKLML